MNTPPFVNRIPTSRADLYAFEIMGEVSEDDMEDMAKVMNAAFDAHEDKVDMMLIFGSYDGAEQGAMMDMDVIKSRLASLTHVKRYVVVGAPEAAETAIRTMGKLLPVEAHTFALGELEEAWALLRAKPVATS